MTNPDARAHAGMAIGRGRDRLRHPSYGQCAQRDME